MKSEICNSTLLKLVLLILAAVLLSILMFNSVMKPFVWFIMPLIAMLISRVLYNEINASINKKVIMTKKKIILFVCFVIIMYLLMFHVFDLILVNSLKNI